MTESQKIELRRSKVRERLGEIQKLAGDAYGDEVKAEERGLQDEYVTLEQRSRSAIIAEDQLLDKAKGEAGDSDLDAEHRERFELRSKVRLSNYLHAAAQGRRIDGAESELQAAAGVNGIPLELFEPAPQQRSAEDRSITPAPGTVGVNLDPIRPYVFANSIASKLGIDMPRVPSGTYATATITTPQEAEPKAKSGSIAATVGAMTVSTAKPKRISARLELTIEDIASVGAENFESILRQNLALALSDELDDQVVNGDQPNNPSGDQVAELEGVFSRLTNPGAPGGVADFDGFATAHASGVDGLWANTIKEVSIVVGPATYRLAARTFQSATNFKGEMSAAAYAMGNTGGFWTSKRMPVASGSHVQQAILYCMGRSGMGASMGMRTAVCPHWGEISIDDIYSGSAKGERYFTMHLMVGDVILVQPDAYSQLAFQVA